MFFSLIVPSEAAAGTRDYAYEVGSSMGGRCPSYLVISHKEQFEKVATDFEDTIDFKQNSDQWTSSNSKSGSGSGSGSGSRSGSGSGSGAGSPQLEGSLEPNTEL